MPETLETLAARIDALSKSFDEGFSRLLAGSCSQLAAKIDALDEKVVKLYDEVVAMREEANATSAESSLDQTR